MELGLTKRFRLCIVLDFFRQVFNLISVLYLVILMLVCHNNVDHVLVEMVKVNHASLVILRLWIFQISFVNHTLETVSFGKMKLLV